jgi:hypothetical protein
MNKPVVKIEKGLAEILNFPEEPSVKFLKDYTIKNESIEEYDTTTPIVKIKSIKYVYSIVKIPILIENIHNNIYRLFVINELFKNRDYVLSTDEGKLKFTFNEDKKIYHDYAIAYTVKLHYKYTDYNVYSESYRIANSPDSKDFKSIIIEKIKEKIYYCLNELNKIFKNQEKVIWNNLIELCGFDTSKLDINVQDFIVDKTPLMKNFLKYKTRDSLEDVIYDKPRLEDIYQEINNSNYFYIINYYINLLNDVYNKGKIVCFLQFIKEINLESFGSKTVNLLIETGLPF